jgi:predicted O-linked N-acetylglucosamine transferase (SPINDLY family)
MSSTGSPILDQMRYRASQLFQSGKYTEAAAAYRGIMEVVPSDFDAIHHLGLVALQLGHLEEARKLLQGALNLKPDHVEACLHHGMALQHLGRNEDAVASYERVLELKPDYPEAVFCLAVTQKNAGRTTEALAAFGRFILLRGDVPTAFLHRGDLLREGGKFAEALADYESALTLRQDFFDGWMHRGVLLAERGRAEEALACYDKAGGLSPNRGDVWYNRGVALQDLGRNAEALEAYDQSIKFAPDFPDAWNNRGALLRKAGKVEEALASFQHAIKLRPDLAQALNNQGSAFAEMRRDEEALESYDRALALAPQEAEGWYNRGIALHNLARNGEALDAYDRAVALDPKSPKVWNGRGNILRDERKFEEAMGSYQRALAVDPRHADTLSNIGGALQDLKRFADAAREFRKLQMVDPDHKYLLGGLALSALMLCDWKTLDEIKPELETRVRSGKSIIPPFTLLGLSSDASLLRACAEHYRRDSVNLARVLPPLAAACHDRIRLAYVSNDFHAHATARLMSDLFERHDRSRFEVIAISFGPDEKSAARERLKKAFDQFHDVRAMKDGETAALIKKLEVDIAIDLKVYTEAARPAIFAHRPAPVQVNYLGFPGTSAAETMDYIIGDPVVLPFDQQPFYSERIVHLPDTYQSNDPKRAIGSVPLRTEAGLPEKGFVFCCFNNHWKITAPVFAAWMRLLEGVPDSVLWLLDDCATANLRHEAGARGIAPERLIFAPKLEHDAHLGRLSLADLVLDTLPYNAHTTASDALWAGVPVVTVLGEAFAGRVGASLLTAIGLPELIADDLEGYEKLAKSLAKTPETYKALKQKLEKNRLSTPLFDAERFCRHIEAAFTVMAEAARRGERPKSFSVPV